MDFHENGSSPFAWRLEKVGRVDSSNDLVLKRARDGEREGLAIWAQSQRNGRGRLGRSWTSPPGAGLYFSVLLRPPVPAEKVAALSLVAAVAMAEGLSQAGGIPVGLKWPNDLRLAGKKMGGILLEYEPKGGKRPWVVVGVGINLKSPPEGYPAEFRDSVTSMEAAGCRVADEGEIIQTLLGHLARWYGDFLASGFERVRQRWEALCDGIDKHAAVSVAGGPIEGIMRGIDAGGRLLLEESSGELRLIDAGEVVER